MRNKLVYILFAILVVLLPLTFLPSLVDMTNEEQTGGVLTPYILMVFASLYVCSFSNYSIKNKFAKTYIVFYLIILLEAICLALIGSPSMLGYECRAFLITFIAVLIGLQIRLTKKQLLSLLLVFCIGTCYVGLLQIFINGNGFVITQYFAYQKNALGVLVGSSGVVAWGLYLDKEDSKIIRILGVGLLILSFIILLTIRARTALLSTAFVIILMFFLSVESKGVIQAFLLTAIVIFALILFMPTSFGDYIYDSIFYGSGSVDLTSGRSTRNAIAVSFIKENFLLGYLGTKDTIPIPHNFLLITWVKYGLFISIPIVLLYLFLAYSVANKSMRSRAASINSIGYYIMIVPLIGSLAEYTLPFGPGTVTVVNFILLGVALKSQNIE